LIPTPIRIWVFFTRKIISLDNHPPDCAMLLAAGLGTRMRPLTNFLPKPLVTVAGRAMIDRVLDALEKTHVKNVVVNLHHLGEQVKLHLQAQQAHRPFQFIFSDERAKLLDSGGGVVKALPYLGKKPFFILNTDSFWHEGTFSNLNNLARNFDTHKMDMMLLTVRRRQAALPERGDFLIDSNGQLNRAPENQPDALIHSGALITTPTIFKTSNCAPHSLNMYFDRAIATQRLYGLALQGNWYTVGTVAALAAVESILTKGRNDKEI